MNQYQAELLAGNNHENLEEEINVWLKLKRPERIVDVCFVADGAEFTYCILILYVPRVKPLPK